MEISKETLTLLFYLGLWKPCEWSPGNYKSLLYSGYTIFIITLTYTFFITELLDLIFVTNNVTEFTNNLFLLMAIFAACAKIYIFLRRRDIFQYIFDHLNTYLFNEKNTKEEIAIWTRYSQQIKFLTMSYLCVNFIILIMFTYGRASANIKNRELPYRAWVPYNYTRPVMYWVSASGQLATVYVVAGVNISFVLLFAGIMIGICAQINILKAKFKRHFSFVDLPDYHNTRINTPKIIGDLVDSYHSIKRLYETVNHLCSWVVLFQYWVGSIIFCASAYHMSQIKPMSFDFFSSAFYVTSIMAELFIVCFFCNEVTFEFAKLHGAFYDCKWYLLNNYNKKSIGFMMTNSMKPIYFTCGYVIHLSLDSFTSVLKLSYSIYNILQSTF